MAPSKGSTSVLFVGRSRLSFYTAGSASIISLNLSNNLVQDLDVVDEKALSSNISGFIKQSNLVPGELVVVLSEAICFSRDIPVVDENQRKTALAEFSESVPFDYPAVKIFELPNKALRIIAVNKNLYELTTGSLRGAGFEVLAVTPAFLLGDLGAKADLDVVSANGLLDDISQAKRNSFLEIATNNISQTVTGEGRSLLKNKRSLILIGVFVVSLIALVTLIIFR